MKISRRAFVENVSDDLPVVKGRDASLLHQRQHKRLFRLDNFGTNGLKKDNFKTERALTKLCRAAGCFCISLLGAPYPQGFVDTAYNWLLQNHGHDSIGGCSRDIIGQDMVYRTRQSRQISSCVTERAMLDIVGSIDLSKYKPEDMALVVFNPASFARSEVMSANIEIPQEWKAGGFEIVDEKQRNVNVQILRQSRRKLSYRAITQ